MVLTRFQGVYLANPLPRQRGHPPPWALRHRASDLGRPSPYHVAFLCDTSPLRPILHTHIPHLLAPLLPTTHPHPFAGLLCPDAPQDEVLLSLPRLHHPDPCVQRSPDVDLPHRRRCHRLVKHLLLPELVPTDFPAHSTDVPRWVPGWSLGDYRAGETRKQTDLLV